MRSESDWKRLGFNSYILYIEGDHNIFVSGFHSNPLGKYYFNCILNHLIDTLGSIRIFTHDINIQQYMKDKLIDSLNDYTTVDDLKSLFKHSNNIKIENNIIIDNFIGGGYVI